MAESSTTLHESREQLTEKTVENHRGLVSLMEELEAVDWYNQRVDAATDAELKAILAHNRDEEKEHAMMLLEWLRRDDPVLDKQMQTYLFSEGDILAAEENANDAASSTNGSLDVGSLQEAQ